MLSMHANQERYPGWTFFPIGTWDRKAIHSTWHFQCICFLAGVGGRLVCIKSCTTFLLFLVQESESIQRVHYPWVKRRVWDVKKHGSVSYTNVEVLPDGRCVTHILTFPQLLKWKRSIFIPPQVNILTVVRQSGNMTMEFT